MTMLDPRFVAILCCPSCRGDLAQPDAGSLLCSRCSESYVVRDGIPRFVPAENYASNFGLQWNLFRRTQLDSFSGHPISRQRFLRYTGWTEEDMRGALVLDVGCGAGRFTEIALSLGARVVALDYSSAVDACRRNHDGVEALSVVQADIYRMPFKDGVFDRVYCFGVLQHTPDVEKSFLALPAVLKGGGAIAVDVYPKLWTDALWPKYWLRHLTKRLSPETLFERVRTAVRWFWPVSLAVGRIPVIGRKLRYLIPIVNYEGVYPLSPQQLKDWAVLDTFDMLAPAYDQPQSAEALHAWFQSAGLEDVNIFRSGFLVGRGTKAGAGRQNAARTT
jgi:SAM-dependent methyltransferase